MRARSSSSGWLQGRSSEAEIEGLSQYGKTAKKAIVAPAASKTKKSEAQPREPPVEEAASGRAPAQSAARLQRNPGRRAI